MSRRNAGIIGADGALGMPANTTTPSRCLALLGCAAIVFIGAISAVVAPRAGATPASGVLIGAYPAPRGTETTQQAVERVERDLGATLPVVRDYASFGKHLDNPYHKWAIAGGRRLFISFTAKRDNGTKVLWSDIGKAAAGSTIYNDLVAMADSAKALGAPLILAFHHEPEAKTNLAYGTSADFIDAWRNVVTIFRARGVNAKWVWTMTSWAYEVNTADRRSAGKWYPGDAYVDYLGADPYNWNQCRGSLNETWEPLATTIAPFVAFADSHPTKKLALPEFGSDEAGPGAKAAWLNEVRTLMKQAPYADRFAVVSYFHNQHAGEPDCSWWLDSSPATLTAAAGLFGDAYFRNTAAVN